MKTYGQYVLKCSVGIWTDSSHAVICLKKYKKRENQSWQPLVYIFFSGSRK